jgi:hypothetical protein
VVGDHKKDLPAAFSAPCNKSSESVLDTRHQPSFFFSCWSGGKAYFTLRQVPVYAACRMSSNLTQASSRDSCGGFLACLQTQSHQPHA